MIALDLQGLRDLRVVSLPIFAANGLPTCEGYNAKLLGDIIKAIQRGAFSRLAGKPTDTFAVYPLRIEAVEKVEKTLDFFWKMY